MRLYLNDDFARHWAGADPFDAAGELSGEVFRAKEGRRTLRFELGGRSYFLKLHRGIGWGEVFKNLSQLRLPVLGAANEFDAARALAELGVDTLTPVAFGARGLNPAQQLSFIVTEDLAGTVSLEDLCRDWPQAPPPRALKQALLQRLARVSRVMHGAGINHRDYYICHFLLDPASVGESPREETLRCYLIDLHRAQQRSRVPRRWTVKDIAGLFYSAMDIGLSRRDLLRFMAIYMNKPWRQTLSEDARFWQQVRVRAEKLYRKDHHREPPRWL